MAEPLPGFDHRSQPGESAAAAAADTLERSGSLANGRARQRVARATGTLLPGGARRPPFFARPGHATSTGSKLQRAARAASGAL
jgi:hypothetical protein